LNLASPKPPSTEQRKIASSVTTFTLRSFWTLMNTSPRTLILIITLVLSLLLAISARVNAAQDTETTTTLSSSNGFVGRNVGKRAFLSASSSNVAPASAPVMAPDMMMSSSSDSSFASPQMMKMDMGSVESSSSGGMADMSSTVNKMRDAALSSSITPPTQGTLIHRSGFVSVESMDVAKAMEKIKKQIVNILGGYEESTSSHEDQWLLQRWDEYRKAMVQAGKVIAKEHEILTGPTNANINFRVPSTKFEDALQSIRKIALEVGGKVLNENTNGVDVTETYVDVVARQSVDTKALSQLDVLLSAAASVSDVLNIRREMDHINSRLESLAAQRKSLEGRASMSSLSLSIQLPQPPPHPTASPTPLPVWSAGGVFSDAFKSLGTFAKIAIEILIYAAVFSLPVAFLVITIFYSAKSVVRYN
jgi:hypothetical protein